MKLGYLDIEEVNKNEFIICQTYNMKYVKLGIREVNYLIEILNEKKFKETEEYSNFPLEDKQKKLLYKKFEEWGFLNDKQNIKKRFRISDFRIFVFRGKLFENWCRFCSCFFSRIGLFLLALSVVMQFFVFYYSGLMMQKDISVLSNFNIHISEILILYLLQVFMIFMHESAHASACYKYSKKCGIMGLKMFYLFPTFFCDVSSMYVVSDKKKSAVVAMAGLLSNFLVGSILLVIYAAVSHYGFDAKILLLYYCINWVVIIMNLIPFAKWDGYWLLKSIVKVENLYDKSVLAFIGIFNKSKKSAGQKNLFLTIYGGCIYVFHWLFWGYSIYIISQYLARVFHSWLYWLLLSILILLALRDSFRFSIDYHKKHIEKKKEEELI